VAAPSGTHFHAVDPHELSRGEVSEEGLAGMELAANELLGIADKLSDQQWLEPSGAGGWSVKDVVCHAGCLMEFRVAAVGGAEAPPMGIERINDALVAEKRHLSGAETIDFVRGALAVALQTFGSLQEEPLASTRAQLADLGKYPLHSIVDMFTFDISCRLLYDLLLPRGPIDAEVAPLDKRLLGPAVSWLLGGIPQMQPTLPESFIGTLTLVLTGPAGTTVEIRSNGGAIGVSERIESQKSLATITSDTTDFMAWSTTRIPWAGVVSIEGDTDVATKFLDGLNSI
jgi:hypothetical protein